MIKDTDCKNWQEGGRGLRSFIPWHLNHHDDCNESTKDKDKRGSWVRWREKGRMPHRWVGGREGHGGGVMSARGGEWKKWGRWKKRNSTSEESERRRCTWWAATYITGFHFGIYPIMSPAGLHRDTHPHSIVQYRRLPGFCWSSALLVTAGPSGRWVSCSWTLHTIYFKWHSLWYVTVVSTVIYVAVDGPVTILRWIIVGKIELRVVKHLLFEM